MKDDLLKICNIYRSICESTWHGKPKGIKIKDLKKQYGLKQRDMLTLLRFLQDFMSLNSEDRYSFEIMRYPKQVEDESSNFWESDYEVDLGEGQGEFQNIKDTDYILIHDNVELLLEKLDETDVDRTNPDFVARIISENKEKWKEICNASFETDVLVNKAKNSLLQGKRREIKLDWLNAVLMKKYVNLTYKIPSNNIKTQRVVPLGFYYTYFSDEYRCIYLNEEEEVVEIEISNIVKVSILKERKEYSFDLAKYLYDIRTEDLVLRVYKEGNVVKKFTQQLTGYMFEIDEKDDYMQYRIKTDNVWLYEKVIKSYGRSIIVEEPQYFREYFRKETESALTYYLQLGDKY